MTKLAQPQITPHRITKPIQLLAAWLAGLAIVDASFLTAAATIQTPGWAPGVLVVAAVLNVPVFLLCLFLLQTKFRPEMQEDSYYSTYLASRSSIGISDFHVDLEQQKRQVAQNIMANVVVGDGIGEPGGIAVHSEQESQIVEILNAAEVEQLANRFGSTRTISELYLYPNLWKELVASWGHYGLQQDVTDLAGAGLVVVPDDNYSAAKLTATGEAVAKKLETEKKLWNSSNERSMLEDVAK